ncbi:MAG: cation:proton antiporter [Pseudomonadota bacterium]
MEQQILKDLIIFLVAAGLVVPIFKHFKISPILGFIIVGLIVGPYGTSNLMPGQEWLQYLVISDPSEVALLAELGIIFLLFMIGLELSLERLWAMRRLVLGMGSVQVLVTAVVIGIIAYLWGNSMAAAIILGGCLALSSTAMVLQLLVDQGRFGSPAGHASFSILLAQDLAVIPLLFLVVSFGTASGDTLGAELGFALTLALVTIVGIYVIGTTLLKPFLRFVGRQKSPELLLAATLLIVIATAGVAHIAGMSSALGAFLAGLLLSESEYRHDIELYIEPFKGLLLGLFFMSVAMGINLAEAANFPGWILASAAGLFAIKATITTLIARVFGFNWQHAGETGVILAQGGEFAFVVIGMAMTFSLLPEDTGQFMLMVVGATMMATPAMAAWSRKIGEREDTPGESAQTTIDDDIADHVILVGFGRTGRLLSGLMNTAHIPFIAIDRDTKANAETSEVVHLGNAQHSQVLRKFGADKARALVICINDPNTIEQIIHAARLVAPALPVLVRAHDETQADAFISQGATIAVPEVLESGLQLATALLTEMDIPNRTAQEMVSQLRASSSKKIVPQIS